MFRRLMALVLTAGLLAPATLFATEVIYQRGDAEIFRFSAPEGWEVRAGTDVSPDKMPDGLTPAPRVISLRAPDESGVMWTGLWAPPGVTDAASARDYIASVGPRLLTEPEVTYNDRRTINGRPAQLFSGIGMRDGVEFDFAFAAISVSPQQIVFAVFIGEPDIYDALEQDLIAVLNSIRAGGGSQ